MEELLNYYRNLLIIQYHGATKARATIDSMTNLLWANQLLKQIRDGFDLGSARVVRIKTQNPEEPSITNVLIKFVEFDNKVNPNSGDYYFQYIDNEWVLNNQIVNLSDYGLTVIGTPENGDGFIIEYKAWTCKSKSGEQSNNKQLDVIGLWVGVDRYIYQKPYDNHPWLSLIEISGAITTDWQGGYSTPSTFDTLGGFLTPDLVIGGNYTELTDEQFITLIKLKIIKNSISHTCKNIDDAIYGLFGNKVITKWDTTNHILYYEHDRDYAPSFLLKVADKKNALPCPTACRAFVREKQT